VLLPWPDGNGAAAAWAFDPTHGEMATIAYVTVAVGRDYRDVAPTSGTYTRGPSGRLTSSKRVEITHLEYDSA
jgi:transglutaminase-like putative cysteine protease